MKCLPFVSSVQVRQHCPCIRLGLRHENLWNDGQLIREHSTLPELQTHITQSIWPNGPIIGCHFAPSEYIFPPDLQSWELNRWSEPNEPSLGL